MSVELLREGWLELFEESRQPSLFLSRDFTVKRGGIYNGAKVAIDIQRFDDKVAPVVTEFTGPNLNDFSQYTTKEFEPPQLDEGAPVNVTDLINRLAGVDPYTAAYTTYAGQLQAILMRNFVQLEFKIQRHIELQASQILQTATLTLPGPDGNTAYTLDFHGKASHFPTVATGWSDPTSDPIADILPVCNAIQNDSGLIPDQLYLGDTALSNFLKNANVKEYLDNRRITAGELRPQYDGSGAVFWGFVWVGNFQLEIWGYSKTYKNGAGSHVRYLQGDKAIIKSSQARLDKTFARPVMPLGPDPRVAGLLPGRVSSLENGGMDMLPNVYCTPNGKQIMAELESRPLLIPVQIDGFGCIDTQP